LSLATTPTTGRSALRPIASGRSATTNSWLGTKASLDILPRHEVIAAEIVEGLEAALAEVEAVATTLGFTT
jgi:hypothetical protein